MYRLMVVQHKTHTHGSSNYQHPLNPAEGWVCCPLRDTLAHVLPCLFIPELYNHADKCAWKFGTISKNPAGKIYNVQLTNGMFCLLQQNWYPFTGAVKGGPPGNTAARTAGCYTR